MSPRAAILAGLALLGMVLLGNSIFAPPVLAETRALLDVERLERLVARAGLWRPVLIITLMTVVVVASPILSAAMAIDAVVQTALAVMTWRSDPLIVGVGIVGMALVFLFAGVFLARNPAPETDHEQH